MQRVTRSTAAAVLPAAPASPGTPGYFTGGDPVGNVPATVPGYEWFNGVQEELIGVIIRSGLTPDQADLAQLRKSLDRLFGGGLRTVSANTTLTPNDAGLVLVDTSAGSRTITLPAASAAGGRPIRYRIVKADTSANTVTIQCAGGDTIEGDSSIVLTTAYSSADLVSNGVNAWVDAVGRQATTLARGTVRLAHQSECDAGTAANIALAPISLGINTRSLAGTGYQRLPGGLILQWGLTNIGDIGASPTSFTATFPIAFPTACLALQATEATVSNGSFSIVQVSFNNTGCTVTLEEWTSVVQQARAAYLAIGH